MRTTAAGQRGYYRSGHWGRRRHAERGFRSHPWVACALTKYGTDVVPAQARQLTRQGGDHRRAQHAPPRSALLETQGLTPATRSTISETSGMKLNRGWLWIAMTDWARARLEARVVLAYSAVGGPAQPWQVGLASVKCVIICLPDGVRPSG